MKDKQPLTVRIYFEDTDAGGIVYHANYLKYMERARTEWLREIGFEQDSLLEQSIAFVVKQLNINYIAPAKFNQLLSIHTQIVKLNRASMVFKQTITNQDNKLITAADVTVACVQLQTGKPSRIPAQILGEISRVI